MKSWSSRKSWNPRCTAAGLTLLETTGVFYNPLTDSWNRSRDTDVNYMMLATRVSG